VDYIRGELSEFDRMAVITFETSAVEVHQLLRLNDDNKAYTASLCQGLRPGGGTTILSGLKAASAMIQRRQTQNPITSVFLLTDGVDGSHVSEKKVASPLS
jgi:Mg-chelatase subunit ChlD